MFDAVRFFRVVPPVPSSLLATFAVVTVVSITAIAIEPMTVRGTLTAVLVLQLFASSSGFAGQARRGHYDLLLTRGERRSVIAAVHWAMSALPGVASWIAIAIAEAIATGGEPGVALTSGTTTALVVVSTIAWAATVPLPRYAGAIGWIMLVVMGTALVPAGASPAPVETLVYPARLIGHQIGQDLWSALPAIGLTITSMVCALRWVERANVPLEAAQ
jgi:hypothetical protein